MEKIDNLDKQILEIISRMLVFRSKMLLPTVVFHVLPFTNVFND